MCDSYRIENDPARSRLDIAKLTVRLFRAGSFNRQGNLSIDDQLAFVTSEAFQDE